MLDAFLCFTASSFTGGYFAAPIFLPYLVMVEISMPQASLGNASLVYALQPIFSLVHFSMLHTLLPSAWLIHASLVFALLPHAWLVHSLLL
jgi:hypothetical protein